MKTLANEPELTDNEMGESDSDGVYEFTQDAHYNDQRDPQRWKAPGRKALKCLAFWNVVCETFRKIVDSKYFGRGIMIAILINTLSMGIEYHEQPVLYNLEEGVFPYLAIILLKSIIWVAVAVDFVFTNVSAITDT
ncbi:UNVERIFIED_CONTAM: Voltage-dependent T-type calcium channel subunit alpha-1G [Gekko kuhli]